MIPRIQNLSTLPNYFLRVIFDDGKAVVYDVKDDMGLPGYDALRTAYGLFEQAQLDKSRTCVFWNDEIDLPSDIIYEYGVEGTDPDEIDLEMMREAGTDPDCKEMASPEEVAQII